MSGSNCCVNFSYDDDYYNWMLCFGCYSFIVYI